MRKIRRALRKWNRVTREFRWPMKMLTKRQMAMMALDSSIVYSIVR